VFKCLKGFWESWHCFWSVGVEKEPKIIIVQSCPECPHFKGDYLKGKYICGISGRDIRQAKGKPEGAGINWKDAYSYKCPLAGQQTGEHFIIEGVIVHQFPKCATNNHEWGVLENNPALKDISLCKVCGTFQSPIYAQRKLHKPLAHLKVF
jgi:hypothetical protein